MNEFLAAISVIVGAAFISSLIWWLTRQAYLKGRADAALDQFRQNQKVDAARDTLDQEIAKLSDDELDARFARWLRERDVDPRR
jgi:cell division protein FtsB